MADSRCEQLIKISDRLFSKKSVWDQMCQDICEQFYPLRADFTSPSPIGFDFANGLMDGSPVLMRETLGNMPEAMLRQGKWFTQGTGDPEKDRRIDRARALDMSTTKLRTLIGDRRSNWSICMKEVDHDWVTIGNPVMSVDLGDTRDHLLYRAWHPGKCAWILDDAGRVVAMFRKVRITARNMINKVDAGVWSGNLNQSVKTAGKEDPTQEFNCLHILMGVDEIYGSDPVNKRRIRQPYISIYIDVEHRTYLNDAGAPVFNYIAPRNRQLSNHPWGFSPYTLNAMQDARMLQSLALILLEQGEKAVDPPIVAAGDIFTRDVNLFAGGTTFVDLPEGAKVGDVMTTLQTGDRMNVGLEMKQDVRQLIAESMLTNKLMLPSLREMRELEVATRNEEFRRTALPFFSPIESEMHTPILSVSFDLAAFHGLIDMATFPKDIDGAEVKWTFESPLNEVEGRKIVEAYFADVQILAAAKEVTDTVDDLIDFRIAATDAMRGGNTPLSWFGTEDEQKARKAKAEQKGALREAASVAQGGAGAIADLANANLAAQQAGMM
jgi:hypothetical protein